LPRPLLPFYIQWLIGPQHFELLPEPTLREAQKALLDEITPSIAHLLNVASNHVERLALREEALKAKCLLQEGRLERDTTRPAPRRGVAGSNSGSTQQQERKAAELRKLVQKKERLQYAVDRLELQSKQRERQLRKSMAAQ
jgi:DASH complex subunit SPC19